MTDLRSGLMSFTSHRLICNSMVRLFSLLVTCCWTEKNTNVKECSKKECKRNLNTDLGTSNVVVEFTLFGLLQLPVEFARPRVNDSRERSFLHIPVNYSETLLSNF